MEQPREQTPDTQCHNDLIYPVSLIVFLSNLLLPLVRFNGPQKPCELVQRAKTIFVGQVVSITHSEKEVSAEFPRADLIRLSVLDGFPNRSAGNPVTEVSGSSEDLAIGHRYLVYSYAPQFDYQAEYGEDFADLIPLEEAQLDLQYLRRLSPATPAGINGYIEDAHLVKNGLLPWAPDWAYSLTAALFSLDWRSTLLPGVTLRLQSDGQAPRFALSNGQGRFQFGDLRPGKYRLSIVEQNSTLGRRDSELTVAPGGCLDLNLAPLPLPAVLGHLSLDGGIAPGVELQLASARKFGTQQYSAVTHGAGSFEFTGIAPGDYYLGVNLTTAVSLGKPYPRWFYPGVFVQEKATVMHLTPGSVIENIDFRLPSSKPRSF